MNELTEIKGKSRLESSHKITNRTEVPSQVAGINKSNANPSINYMSSVKECKGKPVGDCEEKPKIKTRTVNTDLNTAGRMDDSREIKANSVNGYESVNTSANVSICENKLGLSWAKLSRSWDLV